MGVLGVTRETVFRPRGRHVDAATDEALVSSRNSAFAYVCCDKIFGTSSWIVTSSSSINRNFADLLPRVIIFAFLVQKFLICQHAQNFKRQSKWCGKHLCCTHCTCRTPPLQNGIILQLHEYDCGTLKIDKAPNFLNSGTHTFFYRVAFFGKLLTSKRRRKCILLQENCGNAVFKWHWRNLL